MDIDQLTFYTFFLVSLAIACNSLLRVYQSGLSASGLSIKNEQLKQKQAVASGALLREKKLIDQRQRIIDSLVENLSTEGADADVLISEDRDRRELEPLKKAFDSEVEKTAQEHARIDEETEERLKTHRKRHRTVLIADIALLVLSVGAMVALLATGPS
ncbi:MAG: hypothetical protein M0026_10145 [Nocardiopsaceae bacterium]|nr:hypothetical protein [Nocardiopsaceae bacterium]